MRSAVARQRQHKWSAKLIDRLARVLMREFPASVGFTEHNLCPMRAFYLGYAEEGAIVAQAVLLLPGVFLKQLGAELDGKNVRASLAALSWGQTVLLAPTYLEAYWRIATVGLGPNPESKEGSVHRHRPGNTELPQTARHLGQNDTWETRLLALFYHRGCRLPYP